MSENQILQMPDAINALIASYNIESEEFDALHDKCEQQKARVSTLQWTLDRANAQIADLKAQLAKKDEEFNSLAEKTQDLVNKTHQVEGNAKQHVQMVQQKDRELAQAKIKLDNAETKLKGFVEIENTPKKIREKIKRLQTNVQKEQAMVTQWKNIGKMRQNDIDNLKVAVSSVTKRNQELMALGVYNNNGDTLMVFPKKLALSTTGKPEMVMLYIHKSGRASIVGLDKGGVARLVEPPKGGLRMKAGTIEYATDILGFLNNGKEKSIHELEKLCDLKIGDAPEQKEAA